MENASAFVAVCRTLCCFSPPVEVEEDVIVRKDVPLQPKLALVKPEETDAWDDRPWVLTPTPTPESLESFDSSCPCCDLETDLQNTWCDWCWEKWCDECVEGMEDSESEVSDDESLMDSDELIASLGLKVPDEREEEVSESEDEEDEEEEGLFSTMYGVVDNHDDQQEEEVVAVFAVQVEVEAEAVAEGNIVGITRIDMTKRHVGEKRMEMISEYYPQYNPEVITINQYKYVIHRFIVNPTCPLGIEGIKKYYMTRNRNQMTSGVPSTLKKIGLFADRYTCNNKGENFLDLLQEAGL